jgi:hypothetical protein
MTFWVMIFIRVNQIFVHNKEFRSIKTRNNLCNFKNIFLPLGKKLIEILFQITHNVLHFSFIKPATLKKLCKS